VSSDALSQLLTLYAWFPLAGFLFFLLLIARLYEKFSGEKTHFRWFVIPVFLFGVYAIDQTNRADHSSTVMPLLPAVGGLLLVALCYHLYRRMLSHV
jgi:hypothetical protein